MRVENSTECPAVAGRDGATKRLALGRFLANAFVNEHVGIYRHADGQHEAGNTGEGKRRSQGAHDADQNDDVRDQRHIGNQARNHIVNQHEHRNRQSSVNRRPNAAADRVLA